MASAVVSVFSFIRNALLIGAQMGTTLAGTYAATVIAGVVTAGIAVGTARAFGAMLAPDIPGMGPNPGTRIQLAPDTGNKIQVCYGNVLTSGPICDANISNENKTMHYFTVLSEKTDSGTFTIGSQGIRFGDKKLNFGTGATAHQITGVYDANGTSVTNWAGKIRIRVYAGGTAAGNQIFPVPGGSVTAVAATTMMPHWDTTTNYKATDLVFAMTEIDYDAEEGLVNMDAMTFDLRNSLRDPGAVILDYMQNSRYGANINSDIIDTDSFTGSGNTTIKGYSAETITYTPSGGGSATQPRYEIHGTLGTVDDVQSNLDKLLSSCGAYLLFDGKQGKYKGLPNQIYQDQANCFVANDDNIISKVNVQNTDLYQQYNAVEIEYFDKERRDQRNSVLVETPSGERNTGEPDNKLSYSLDMVNNKPQVEILANIDLKQTRLDKVVTFTGDHSFLQIDTGDVIKFNNTTYGFTDKLFRVMRLKEKENLDSTLSVEIIALEYSDDVYTQPSLTTDAPFANISIPTLPVVGPIHIPGVMNGSYAGITLDSDIFGNVLVNQHMKTFGAGAQLTDQPNNHVLANTVTTYRDITTEESYDISDSDIGDHEFSSSANLGGTLTGTYDIGFRQKVTLGFANSTATSTQIITGGGIEIDNMPSTTPPPPLNATFKVSTDPTAYGFASDMKPTTANIVLQGYSDIGGTGEFGGLNYEFLRVTKGEKE